MCNSSDPPRRCRKTGRYANQTCTTHRTATSFAPLPINDFDMSLVDSKWNADDRHVWKQQLAGIAASHNFDMTHHDNIRIDCLLLASITADGRTAADLFDAYPSLASSMAALYVFPSSSFWQRAFEVALHDCPVAIPSILALVGDTPNLLRAPLERALEVDDMGALGAVLKHGHHVNVDINARSERGEESVLMTACRQKNVKAVALLVQYAHKHELRVNDQNSRGETALIIACQSNDDRGVTAALAKHSSVDVHVCDAEGYSALTRAASNQHQVDSLQALLERKAHLDLDINKKDDGGRTPLFVACRHQARAVELLFAYDRTHSLHVNVSLRGITPLKIACAYNPDAAGMLLSNAVNHGLDVNYTGVADGSTALMVACNM
jgi:ankyrin repeat protein